MKISSSPFLFCIIALSLIFPKKSTGSENIKDPVLRRPVYHLPLRVHLGNSRRPLKNWLSILEEINFIWLSQADICFEIHTVAHDEELETGLDLWFESTIPNWNGYFTDMHDMHVRDEPQLRPAQNPASSSAARTAAHELGHALSLHHKQNSDDNLMRSKTYGWQLHEDEIIQARSAASQLAFVSTSTLPCNPPAIHTGP